ncbi:hypothetical protein FQR65_LT05106 [Abscondita terminalis]|nr:hypothetical protein FQR65_LT05106 [Abscondita terminalis]
MLSELKKEIADEQICNRNLLIDLLTIKIFHSDKFKELTGGFSSNTYHYEKTNLVLRFPKPHNPLYRHTGIEIHNLSEAKLFGLTPIEIIGYYTKYSLLVTKFIPSIQAYSEKNFKQTEKLMALAHLIKKLHYSEASFKKNPEASLCFIDSSTKTFQTIKSILSEEDYKILHKLDTIRCCLAKFNIIKRPVHGDLHHFNLIEINGKMQLMDWELSTLEDPALDISRFFCVSDLNNEQKDIFLQYYKSSLNIPLAEADIISLATRVELFEPLNYFSIVVWAKYAILFSHSDKRNLLEATIKNFAEKTLNAIEKIDLATIKILSDVITEKEGHKLQNKNLLIQLLTLKIYQPSQFKEIKGGHSNATYHYPTENLVLRFPKVYNPLSPELSIEIQNLRLARLLNLTPLKIIAYYTKYNFLVTKFVSNYQSLSATDLKKPSVLMALAHLVKNLHYSEFTFKKNSETGISFIDEASQCFQNILPILNKKDHRVLKKLLGIKNFLAKSKVLFPSHGDLHHFNLIENNGYLQLMDWELSSMEDAAYDISRLFCVTGFNSKQKEVFLKTYKYAYINLSASDIKNLIKRIFLYESLNLYSIITWAKYVMPHFNETQQILLKETIKNYSQKDRLIRY